MNIKLQVRPSAPMPCRSTRPEQNIPIAQAVRKRFAKKSASAIPSPHRLNPKNQIAAIVTGTKPTRRRITLIAIKDSTNSIGRSGLIIRFGKLRAHISSRNDMEKPSWPRKSTSHRKKAARNVAVAVTRPPDWRATPSWRNPHMNICTIGQYISSKSRGHEERRRYQCRSTSAPTRRKEKEGNSSRSFRRVLREFPLAPRPCDVEKHFFEVL